MALLVQQDLFPLFSASRGDWLLSFVYRTSSVQLNVAGLQPVDLDDRRMVNMDLSSVVSSHILISSPSSFACSTVTPHSLCWGSWGMKRAQPGAGTLSLFPVFETTLIHTSLWVLLAQLVLNTEQNNENLPLLLDMFGVFWF